jgi:hypothetical protein
MADSTADLSHGPVLLSLSLATASFALATTFVRFRVRRGLDSNFGVDDYTSGAATVSYTKKAMTMKGAVQLALALALTLTQVIALIATIFGILEGSSSDATRALKFNVVGQPWYLISSTLSKASICLFFMVLLRRARHWRILLAGLIVVMGVINLAYAMIVYLQCRPLEKVWNPTAVGCCSSVSVHLMFSYVQGGRSCPDHRG